MACSSTKPPNRPVGHVESKKNVCTLTNILDMLSQGIATVNETILNDHEVGKMTTNELKWPFMTQNGYQYFK